MPFDFPWLFDTWGRGRPPLNEEEVLNEEVLEDVEVDVRAVLRPLGPAESVRLRLRFWFWFLGAEKKASGIAF